MAIKNATPMRFTPRGLVDAFDATDKFPGACTSLSNLIFDQTNPEFVVSRPGVLTLTAFASNGFTNPTFISLQVAIGQYVFGMVATSRNAGQDEPFMYNTTTNAFVTIGTVTAGNTPTSPATHGADWTPPTLASVGTMIVITHPGFNGTNGYYGIIDVTNYASPVWRSENTTTTALPAVPVAVANFNDRAWFALQQSTGGFPYGNWVYYTNVLTNPLTISGATQALVVGDNQPITAMAGLPAQTTSSGIVQSLTIFKKTQIWQVTGDTTQSNLSLNYLSLNIGTLMPRTLVQAPIGLYFISSGGPYYIDQLGGVNPVVNKPGETEPDIQIPFQNAVTPSRWCAAYNSTIYRVCGPTVILGVQSTNDYWFDEHKRRWSGPHTFAYDCASAFGQNFVLSSYLNSGILILGSPEPSTSFPLADLNTVTFTFNLTSSTFPKVGDMLVKQVAESQIELISLNSATTFTISANNEAINQIGQAQIVIGGNAPTWGNPALLWGPVGSGGTGTLWTSISQPYIPRTNPVSWSAPLVFEKMSLSITGPVAAYLGIGTFYARYQKTGYMTTGVQ